MKEIVLFGIPLVSVLVTYDVQIVTKLILNGYTSGYYMEIIKACELTLFALYAVAFMLEISKYSKNKDEVRIIESQEEILELNEEIRNQKLKSFEKLQAKERKSVRTVIYTSLTTVVFSLLILEIVGISQQVQPMVSMLRTIL